MTIWATPAAAQLARITSSLNLLTPPPPGMRGTDVAFDPAHGVFLTVGAYGPLFGVFTNTSGVAISSFPIGSSNSSGPFGHFPRCEYSADINNGQGGFLVTWHENDTPVNWVHTVVVAYPAGVISPDRAISDGTQSGSWWEAGAAIAYSATSHRFLVAWQTLQFGIQGRFVDVTGAPIGPVMLFENAGGARDPGLAWNSAGDNFGLSSSGWDSTSSFAGFRLIAAATGSLSPRLKFGRGPGTYNTDIDVNPTTHNFVMAWAMAPGSSSAEIDPGGSLLGTRLISGRFGGSDNLSLAYNATSGTFLAVGQHNDSFEVAGAELNGQGTPTTGTTVLTSGATKGSFYPRVAAEAGVGAWDISYSRNLATIMAQLISTSTVSAAPPPPGAPATPPAVRSDIRIFRPTTGNWYVLKASSDWTATNVVGWGLTGDIPLQADFDGDGTPDLVTYRPSDGTWNILYSSTNFSYSNYTVFRWGLTGDVPMPGDYDGDGKADVVVWRPSSGTWYGLFSSTGYASIATIQWGLPGDVPVRADFDGDGRTDLVVYRPSEGNWYQYLTTSGGEYTFAVVHFGLSGDVPVPADYDGDGKTEPAIRRGNEWHILNSSLGYSVQIFGDSNAQAVAGFRMP